MTQLPQTMDALVLNQAGADFELVKQSVPLPKLGDRQLLIKVEAVGLNPVDTKLARGGHGKWQYPHVPGLDGVGVVVASYTEHCPLIGKRVMWHSDLTKQGALAQYMVIEAHAVAAVPESIDVMAAATLPCAGMTALQALCKLNLSAGESILIEAGAGAVGQFAIQLAKAKGLTVYATASKARHKYLQKLGADEVFDYRDPAFEDKLTAAFEAQPLDAVIDAMGEKGTERNIRLLKFNGQIACLNSLPSCDAGLLFTQSPTVHIISLGGAWLSGDMCAQQKLCLKGEHLLNLLSNNEITVPPITEIVFDAADVTQAMHAQLDGGVFGKQVVKLS